MVRGFGNPAPLKSAKVVLGRVLINRDYSAIAGCRERRVRNCAGSSGDLLPPSPPAEKATASQDQAGQTGTGDGAGDGCDRGGERQDLGEKLVADDVVRHVRRMGSKVIEVLVGVRASGPT